jgi:hypothetical protein
MAQMCSGVARIDAVTLKAFMVAHSPVALYRSQRTEMCVALSSASKAFCPQINRLLKVGMRPFPALVKEIWRDASDFALMSFN